jgi:hypothetical protein
MSNLLSEHERDQRDLRVLRLLDQMLAEQITQEAPRKRGVSMSSMNKVILVGNLGRDPEVRV